MLSAAPWGGFLTAVHSVMPTVMKQLSEVAHLHGDAGPLEQKKREEASVVGSNSFKQCANQIETRGLKNNAWCCASNGDGQPRGQAPQGTFTEACLSQGNSVGPRANSTVQWWTRGEWQSLTQLCRVQRYHWKCQLVNKLIN